MASYYLKIGKERKAIKYLKDALKYSEDNVKLFPSDESIFSLQYCYENIALHLANIGNLNLKV